MFQHAQLLPVALYIARTLLAIDGLSNPSSVRCCKPLPGTAGKLRAFWGEPSLVEVISKRLKEFGIHSARHHEYFGAGYTGYAEKYSDCALPKWWK
jgi:hypothetical protein